MAEFLEMRGIVKTFPGVLALDHVNLSVRKGEVHALLGENGAGKSTLMKILSGAYQKDEGEIFFDGQKVEINSAQDAQALNISTIYQELNLTEQLTVAENIFMGRQLMKNRFQVDWRRMYDEAQKLLDELGVAVNAHQLVRDLGVAQKQMVEVAKALSTHARIIIMDEPTSSLTDKETDMLLSIIRPALMIAIMTNVYGNGNFSVNLSSYDVSVAAALLLAILLLVHTRKIPWLTAIPRSAGVLLSLVSVVRSVGYYGAPLAPYMIFGTYLPLLISLTVLVLYWVFTLKKRVPAAFAVTVLVLAILGCLINLINLGTEAFSRAMPPHVLVDRLLGAVIGIITEIAYVIALFALRGKPEPRVAPQSYGMPGYSGQPVRSGYDPPAYAPQPPAAQPVYDAPSGGYAALGFFFPVVGLILYLVWKDQTPLRARSAGKGALIGMIVGVVLSILLTIVSVAINASILASLY